MPRVSFAKIFHFVIKGPVGIVSRLYIGLEALNAVQHGSIVGFMGPGAEINHVLFSPNSFTKPMYLLKYEKVMKTWRFIEKGLVRNAPGRASCNQIKILSPNPAVSRKYILLRE